MSRAKRIMIQLGIASVILIAVFALHQAKSYGATVYESEPNDEPYQAIMWECKEDSVLKGVFEYVADDDWIKFKVPKTGIVTFTFTCDDVGTIQLYSDKSRLWADAFNWITADYKASLGYCHVKEDLYLSEGTYYLKLYYNKIYNDNTKTNYTIKLGYDTLEDDLKEPNDFIGAASLVNTNKKVSAVLANCGMSSKLCNKEDIDFIKLNVPYSGTYHFNLKYRNTQNGGYFFMKEYDKSGDKIKNIILSQENDTAKYTRVHREVYLKKGIHYFSFKREKWDGIEGQTAYSFDITKKLTKVTGIKSSKIGSGKVKLSWKKKDGATGYRIYRKSLSTGKYVCIGKTANTSFTDSKAKKGRTNYYKVRAYKTMNGYAELGYLSGAVGKTA